MYTEVVQYSNDPAAVTKLVHPDGVAEYRLTRNVVHEKDNEDNDVIQGEEVYFEIAAGAEQPSAADVEKNFDAYWNSGLKWPVVGDAPKTVEERLEEIEADNVTALEGIAKLEALLTYQGLTVRQVGNGGYEVVKMQEDLGDYLNPIKYTSGMSVTAGLWYYTTDKQLPQEAIASGIPKGFDDRTIFAAIPNA